MIIHASVCKLEEPLVLCGRLQCHSGRGRRARSEALGGDALFLPETRARFRALTNLGLTDAIRATTDAGGLYTFWDYQAGAWQKNNGIRIDHLLLSPQAADRLVTAGIDKHVRAWEKPSDHVPVWIELDLCSTRMIAERDRFRTSSRRNQSRAAVHPAHQHSPASARSSSVACLTAAFVQLADPAIGRRRHWRARASATSARAPA